jgi:hypothetical protein
MLIVVVLRGRTASTTLPAWQAAVRASSLLVLGAVFTRWLIPSETPA